MAESVRQIETKKLQRNKSNPRLIFREEEMKQLEESIAKQGILVPLTVYKEKSTYRILDGERRWRCATSLRLPRVPVIVQPKPGPLENLMMMFAIHHTRSDWDPLPTAKSLERLEAEFEKQHGYSPSEAELAQLASMSRGEVRRLRALLALPEDEQEELMAELEKPRHARTITADQVLEATKAAALLRKRDVVTPREEEKLRRAIVSKFREKVVKNTVDPRKLARLARAVEREEVTMEVARDVTKRLISRPKYSIDDAFSDSVEQHDYLHASSQLASRLSARLQEQQEKKYTISDELRAELTALKRLINRLLG